MPIVQGTWKSHFRCLCFLTSTSILDCAGYKIRDGIWRLFYSMKTRRDDLFFNLLSDVREQYSKISRKVSFSCSSENTNSKWLYCECYKISVAADANKLLTVCWHKRQHTTEDYEICCWQRLSTLSQLPCIKPWVIFSCVPKYHVPKCCKWRYGP